MAALVATKKAPWAEALVLQPPPAQSAAGPSQLKLRVLAAGLAFPDVLSIEGSHGRWTPAAGLATAGLLQLSLWPQLLTAATDSPTHRAAGPARFACSGAARISVHSRHGSERRGDRGRQRGGGL